MGKALPDYAFEGMGDDLLFDRSAAAAQAFAPGVRGMGGLGEWSPQSYELAGVKDFFKAVGGAVVSAGKAVGKGAVNAVGARVGLGPIFKDGQPVPQGQAAGAPAPAPNYTPFIIGGVALVGVIGLALALKRK